MLPAFFRHGVCVPKVTLTAAISTQATQAEAALTAALTNQKWKDVKDEVKSVGSLMREGTTNHSVPLPSSFLKQDVNDKLRRLHSLVEKKQRYDAFAQVRALKAKVKDELYKNHRQQQQQMMAFSTTIADHPVDDFKNAMHELHWADVEGEVDEIHSLMHESSMNHSVHAPDFELEKLIESAIDEIKLMLEKNPTQHGLVFGKIHALKAIVKQRLYSGSNLSTQNHLKSFQKEMEALRWADIKNETEQIHQLMQEHTTNHSVAKPCTELQSTVDDTLRDIDAMIRATHAAPNIHDRVFDRIHNLKGVIKSEIYS